MVSRSLPGDRRAFFGEDRASFFGGFLAAFLLAMVAGYSG
jgi:hypothetical protein